MDRLATRFIVALVAVTAIAVGIIAIGVLGVSMDTFSNLMVSHGETSQSARSVFDQSVTTVFVTAAVVALLLSVVLAVLLALLITRPLRGIESGARTLAGGDYSVRVEEGGSRELASVARSFNHMASTLEAGESLRRQLIADFAHELRTPLTNLQGYLEALRDGVVAPTPDAFTSLGEEVDRLNRLSSSLDALTEGAELPTVMADIDVSGAVTEAANIARPALERRSVRLTDRIQPGLRGRANSDRLAQILHNLLSNALRHTPPGGEVVVAASPADSRILVAVANSGDPIPDSELPRLWDRFYRVEKSRDRASGGAGIGLAIVKELVESAGGEVGVESGLGRNRFWFTIPAD